MNASVAALLLVELAKLIGLLAVIAGGIMLLRYKDLETVGTTDPRLTWRMNAVLAGLCCYQALSPATRPVLRPESATAPLFAWLMVAVWLGVAFAHLRPFRTATDGDDGPTLLPSSLGMVTTALIALLEELIFRGWLQNIVLAVGAGYGENAYGIFALNLAFAALHYNRGPIFALSAGFVGTIFSIATLASGSLLPAITMHVGWNLLIGIVRVKARKAEAAA